MANGVRKVWVRRPGASATLVTFGETDVVDDIREMALRKYGNSLGRMFDAPDVTIRLFPRPDSGLSERVLGPDEPAAEILDTYYPGGQKMDEALVIDVPGPWPQSALPSALPSRGGPPHAYPPSGRPDAPGPSGDYFGAAAAVPGYYNDGAVVVGSEYGSTLAPESAYLQHQHATQRPNNTSLRMPPHVMGTDVSSAPPTAGVPAGSPLAHPHSISILSTGQAPQIPPLPSPGGTRRSHKDRTDRPKLNRQASAANDDVPATQASGNSQLTAAGTKGTSSVPASAHPSSMAVRGVVEGIGLTESPMDAADGKPAGALGGAHTTRGNMISSPRPMSPMRSLSSKKKKVPGPPVAVKQMAEDRDTRRVTVPLTVPPINVLIVEDNIINLKLLEAFTKRLKVRWQTAMDGVDAVAKWRTGGFHLVLMDIQLPLMSGLEATREIRRLERVNSIGVFASTPSDSIGDGRDPRADVLTNISLFKSPVIIVALTASSLQSDRNDALAAGCNDFLTKPVNFIWLEKKVTEWGCMQALIDFDGWRRWKELKLPAAAAADDKEKRRKEREKERERRPSISVQGATPDNQSTDTINTLQTLSSAESVPTVTGIAQNAGDARSPLAHTDVADTVHADVADAVHADSAPTPAENLPPPA